jgi:hypothetical protein
MGLPQRRHRRQSVQDVSHGAQPDHKQAKLELRLQALIFSQARVCGTARKTVADRPA